MIGAFDQGVMYALLFVSIYFEVFLLIAFLERHFARAKTRPLSDAELPNVAISVPCYNEERTLATTVASLLSLDYPKHKLEIIIVDDGSTDSTLQVARQFESDSRVKVLRKMNGGKYTAMNEALGVTSADLIGCLDADSIVEPHALRAIAAVFAHQQVAAATPGIHVRNPKTLLQHMQNVEYRLSIFNRFVLAALGSTFITPGPFSLFRTSVVRDLGGWREGHMTEDMEMALRIQRGGYLIANVPTATVHTTTPATLAHLFRQRVRWTYGWLRNAVDYRAMFLNRAYGNLGLLILPSGAVLIFSSIYFFARLLFTNTVELINMINRVYATGAYPQFTFDIFYMNTTALWFLIYFSVMLILALLCAGTMGGTNGLLPPKTTPLFLIYSLLVPVWLSVAVYRATFKTGVRWR